MEIVILLILGGYLYYRHIKKQEGDSRNSTVENDKSFATNVAGNSTYVDPVPYNVRKQNAIDAYLSSNQSTINNSIKDKSVNSNIDDQIQENMQQDISSQDLVVNTDTGEVKTSGEAFKPETTPDTFDQKDESSIVSQADQNTDTSNTSGRVTVSSSQPKTARSMVHNKLSENQDEESEKTENWKENNQNSINDLIKEI